MGWTDVSPAVEWLRSLVIPLLSGGLIGAFLTSWLTARRDRISRQHAFKTKQMQEFYSPLLSLRQEIKAKGKLRVKLSDARRRIWPELVKDARSRGGVEATQQLSTERSREFERMIEWDNDKRYTELIPAYRTMIDVFRENLWLAEKDTLASYDDLVEFVEVWRRIQDKSIPDEVIEAIGHGEENLLPFYEHLETEHAKLRAQLAEGRI